MYHAASTAGGLYTRGMAAEVSFFAPFGVARAAEMTDSISAASSACAAHAVAETACAEACWTKAYPNLRMASDIRDTHVHARQP